MGRSDEEAPETRSSLLVRNLSFRTSQNDLRDVFADVGKVRDVYMPLDYVTRQPRGFAFVEFYSKEDARKAVDELNGKNIDGRDVAIVIAQQRRKKPEEMRDRDGNKDPRGRPPGWRGGDYRHGGGYGRDYSPSPHRGRNYSPRRRSSRDRNGGRHRRYSPSPYARHQSYSRSRSPPRRYSRSPSGSLSPRRDRAVSPSPRHGNRNGRRSRSPSRSYSRSRSRDHADYGRKRSHRGHDGGRSRSSG